MKVGVCKESVLKINLDYEPKEICCRGYYPTVRNVYMENVTSESSQYGVQIIGLEEDTYVYDITVKDCKFNGVKDGNFMSGKTRNVNFDNLFINGSLSRVAYLFRDEACAEEFSARLLKESQMELCNGHRTRRYVGYLSHLWW